MTRANSKSVTANPTPISGAAHRRWVPSAATPLRRRLASRYPYRHLLAQGASS